MFAGRARADANRGRGPVLEVVGDGVPLDLACCWQGILEMTEPAVGDGDVKQLALGPMC